IPDAHIGLDEIVREEYPGGSEKVGRALPGCMTVIAEPAGPQEKMMVPDDPGETWVTFAIRVLEPVPQFGTRMEWSSCVDSPDGIMRIRINDSSKEAIRRGCIVIILLFQPRYLFSLDAETAYFHQPIEADPNPEYSDY